MGTARTLQVAPVPSAEAVAVPRKATDGTDRPMVRLPSRVQSIELTYRQVQFHAWPGRVLWVSLVVLHAVCGAFYLLVAYVYHVLPTTLLAVSLQAFELTIDMRYFPLAVAFHCMCGMTHVLLLVSMVVLSLRQRRLIFKPGRRRRHADSRAWSRAARWIWDAVFGPLGVLGVDHQNFEVIFAFRELLEIVLESVQAYQLSQYVPRVWLNNLWVAIIAVSCWATPALHRIPRLSGRTRLLLALLCDAILDFVASVGSPVALAVPYVELYDFHIQDFVADAWYSDLWFVNMVNEFQIVFIQSWYDFFSRAVFATSLLLCLDDIKILVSTVRPSERVRRSVAERIPLGRSLSSATARSTAVQTVYRLLAVWGIVILGLHFAAMRNDLVPGCQLQVRPWASSRTACAFLLIDCQAHTSSPVLGAASDIATFWADLSLNALTFVTVQGCLSLEIPASIQDLHQLISFNVFDSTLVAWTSDAAFTTSNHPNLRHLGLMAVNFSHFGSGNGSELPAGIMSPDFPTTLFDIFVWNCGWADLPSNLDVVWPHGQNLLLPGNNFSSLPDVVARMLPIRLMLDGNPLTQLPAFVFQIASLESLELPFTALQSLPALPLGLGMPSGAKLSHLVIEHTNVSVLPAWMAVPSVLSRVRVRAEGTPLCDHIARGAPETMAISGRIQC